MKEIAANLDSKNYKLIDITKVLNISTYEKYVTIAKSKPNVVLYSNKNTNNELIFKVGKSSDECNYFFLNKDSYLMTNIKNTFDESLKECIDNLINNSQANIQDQNNETMN